MDSVQAPHLYLSGEERESYSVILEEDGDRFFFLIKTLLNQDIFLDFYPFFQLSYFVPFSFLNLVT